MVFITVACAHAPATRGANGTQLDDWDLAIDVPFQTETSEGELLLGTNVDHLDQSGWSLRIELDRPCSDNATEAEQCAADECRHDVDHKCGVNPAFDAKLLALPARAHLTKNVVNATEELFAVDGACMIRLAVWSPDHGSLDASVAKVLAGLHTISGAAPHIGACHSSK